VISQNVKWGHNV